MGTAPDGQQIIRREAFNDASGACLRGLREISKCTNSTYQSADVSLQETIYLQLTQVHAFSDAVWASRMQSHQNSHEHKYCQVDIHCILISSRVFVFLASFGTKLIFLALRLSICQMQQSARSTRLHSSSRCVIDITISVTLFRLLCDSSNYECDPHASFIVL